MLKKQNKQKLIYYFYQPHYLPKIFVNTIIIIDNEYINVFGDKMDIPCNLTEVKKRKKLSFRITSNLKPCP